MYGLLLCFVWASRLVLSVFMVVCLALNFGGLYLKIGAFPDPCLMDVPILLFLIDRTLTVWLDLSDTPCIITHKIHTIFPAVTEINDCGNMVLECWPYMPYIVVSILSLVLYYYVNNIGTTTVRLFFSSMCSLCERSDRLVHPRDLSAILFVGIP